jgi:hypothetical protein
VRARTALIALLTAAPGVAAAQAVSAPVVSARPDKVAVVLYQDRAPSGSYADPQFRSADPGLAVVSETRTLDLPAGRSTVSFREVADGMVPQTAAIEGIGGKLVERNFDFDLLSPGTLIGKAIGAPARLVRTNPKTGEVTEAPVTVRSGPQGILLQHEDGAVEAVGCSGLPERLVFDAAPPGLTATPTLSAVVEVPRAGRYVVRLSYLATGLRWSADYVARLNVDGRTLDLQGWLTLSNLSRTSFADAPTQVVAGRLARAGDDTAPQAYQSHVLKTCWPIDFVPPPLPLPPVAAPAPPAAMAMARMSKLEEVVVTATRATVGDLGDYKLYSLNEPTTVAANQTKQVTFLAQGDVPYQRAYAYVAQTAYPGDPEQVIPVPVVLRIKNEKGGKLGKGLPGGVVTVFEPRPDGEPSLDGQPRLKDTPVGVPVELQAGLSSLVTVVADQEEQSSFQRADRTFSRSAVALTVRNAGAQPAPVEIRLAQSSFKIVKESRPHGRDGGFALWTLQVPAGGEASLSYRVEER